MIIRPPRNLGVRRVGSQDRAPPRGVQPVARPPANEQPRRFNQNATRYGFGTDAGRPPAAPPRPNPPSTIPNRQYPSAGYHPREGGGWINPAESLRPSL